MTRPSFVFGTAVRTKFMGKMKVKDKQANKNSYLLPI